MPPEGSDPWAAFSGGRIGGGEGGEDEKQSFVHFTRAKELFAQGQLSASVEEAHAASRLQPSNPRPYALAAAALNRLKRFDEAEAEARRAISIKKDNADAYQSMAFAQLQQERYSEAVLSATEAIEHAPRSAQAHALRAFAYEQLGEDALKMADIERAAALDPRAYESYLTTARKGGALWRNRGSASRSTGDLFAHPLALPGLLLLATLILGMSAYFFLSRAPKLVENAAVRPPPVETDEKGLLSGKYELTRVIGKGGMGHVWAAKDHSLNRTVAVKKMSAEMGALGSAARGYYVQEARTVASLHHPHIISIYEILDLPSGVYLVFEMASGKTVQHFLAEKKRLPLARVREIFRPVCDALEFAHGRGFVHRDLKPANIMLTDQGFVKVMDFGIARRVGSRAEAAGDHSPVPDLKGMPVDKTTTIVGTPAYMAPESERGIVTSVSDVFSLGVCFYEMLAGKQPFSSKDKPAKLERRYTRLLELVPELPPEADALAHEAMDPDPETRIPSAREFLNRLEKLAVR